MPRKVVQGRCEATVIRRCSAGSGRSAVAQTSSTILSSSSTLLIDGASPDGKLDDRRRCPGTRQEVRKGKLAKCICLRRRHAESYIARRADVRPAFEEVQRVERSNPSYRLTHCRAKASNHNFSLSLICLTLNKLKKPLRGLDSSITSVCAHLLNTKKLDSLSTSPDIETQGVPPCAAHEPKSC